MTTTDSLSLFVTHPDGQRTEHLLQGEMRVGRSPECEVRVASALLSRVHFSVRREGEQVVVSSTHRRTATNASAGVVLGTYVAGQRVEGSRTVAPGERIAPTAEPREGDPVFVVGPTQSPTPADQLPKGPEGFSPVAMAVGCLVLLAVVGAIVGAAVAFG